MGKIIAVCMSTARGTPKTEVPEAVLTEDWGLAGDAHAGHWHRQVSLLSKGKIDEFNLRGAAVENGAFGENLVVEGFDLAALPVGTLFGCGGAVLRLTQVGKQCHGHCEIFDRVGDCIMPREGVFCRVLRGGRVSPGDEITLLPRFPHRFVVLTASDSRYENGGEDLSGALVKELCEREGLEFAFSTLLPDERTLLGDTMRDICDGRMAELLLTTGGTGFSPRDVTPEATLDIIERAVPGIPEAMRSCSLQFSPRAMLSRAAAGIRGRTLIVNLPGSPKAVRECLEYLLPAVRHGLDILLGADENCARQ